MAAEKLCVFCVHLDFHCGTGGDYPDPAELECRKGHQLREAENGFPRQGIYDIEDFRAMIVKPATCPDYKQVSP